MKNLFYLLVGSFLLLACERSIVEPTYDDPLELDKAELSHENLGPKKSYVTIDFRSQYNFDPSENNGDFLANETPKYSYETDQERFLRNMKVYTPGTLTVGENNYKVVNVYTINKQERLSKKGNVISGNTWGEFRIHLESEGNIKEDERSEKDSLILTKVLNQPELGELILSGKFSGKINGNKIKIKLHGQGHNKLNGAKLVGVEQMTCGEKFCWKSNSSGKVIKVEYKDE